MEISPVFDVLNDEIIFSILDFMENATLDKKSFSLVCKSFHDVESRHRRTLRPLRVDLLPTLLSRRYCSLRQLDLSCCPRVTDKLLTVISELCGSTLVSLNLSKTKLFSHVGLSSLVSNCQLLVELDLSNGTDLTDNAAVAVSRARNLEKLWLARCKLITDLGIGCIAVGCRKLKLVSLKWCLSVTDLGVTLIAVKCRDLRSVDLSYTQITNSCLPSILQLPRLEELTLAGCIGIDNGELRTAQGCLFLKSLDMSYCPNVTHGGLCSIMKEAALLQRLILSQSMTVTQVLADSLKRHSALQSIRLDGCHILPGSLKTIGHSGFSLNELSLSKCHGVMDDDFSFLVAKHKELRKLDITCCRNVTNTSIISLTSSCLYLRSLRMESCCLIPKDSFVLIGNNCRLLEELDITDSEVDDEGLKAISNCSGLYSLKAGICFNLTDAGLLHIGKCCPKLSEIDLYRSVGVTDSAVAAISQGCPLLQMINLAYCIEITDKSMVSLSRCVRLTTIEVRGCPHVSSAGLSAIAMGCKQITTLDIKKCREINDAGMLPLAQLSQNLRQINLSYCSITDMGLLALASISYLQSITILHVSGLTPDGLAAALLACGGLTKVKLHVAFKRLLSQGLIEHIEGRGCVFQWRDKPFEDQSYHSSWQPYQLMVQV